jgi:Carbohydrate esterase, sialic acid-specific acetylesterase
MLSRRTLLAAALPLIAARAAADDFTITEYPHIGGPGNPGLSFTNTADRKPASLVLRRKEKTLTFIAAGQSNIANNCQHHYAPRNAAKVQNLNPFEHRGLYRMADPMLGATGKLGSWLGRLGDKLINVGICGRVIFCPIAVGGTTIAQWAPGGVLHHRLRVALLRCRDAGLPVSGILWHQGENDNRLQTERASYQTHLSALVKSLRAMQFFGPWFIAQVSYERGITSSAVRAAQAAVVSGIDVLSWFDSDSLGASYRYDGVHWNDAGADAAAELATIGLMGSGAI